MDNQGRASVVKTLVDKLRKVTRVTQIAPFVFLLFLAFYLLTESILPDWSLRIADILFFVPVYVTVCLLGIGRLLKLCKWYITACLLPLLTKITSYVDSFVVTLWREEVILSNVILGIIYIIFLFFAYKHFFGGYEC